MYTQVKYLMVGDRGITVEFGNDLEEESNLLVHKMRYALEEAALDGVIETTPTNRSLLVYYDPLRIRADRLVSEIKMLKKKMAENSMPEPSLFEIPVVYGGKYGPDLETAARLADITPEEVVKLHSGREYRILFTGFIGGSAQYKIPPPLDAIKRRKTPDQEAPAGSVIIAGGLGSAIRGIGGLTGWQWIAMSPLRQWQPEKDPPLLINAGDRIIYRAIDEKEYLEIKKLVEKDRYEI